MLLCRGVESLLVSLRTGSTFPLGKFSGGTHALANLDIVFLALPPGVDLRSDIVIPIGVVGGCLIQEVGLLVLEMDVRGVFLFLVLLFFILLLFIFIIFSLFIIFFSFSILNGLELLSLTGLISPGSSSSYSSSIGISSSSSSSSSSSIDLSEVAYSLPLLTVFRFPRLMRLLLRLLETSSSVSAL